MSKKTSEPKKDLRPSSDAIAFATATIRVRLERLLKNREETLTGDRARGVYQMRVWSRRSRAALDTFMACFPEKEFSRFTKEIKRITHALGAARDLDVIREGLEEKAKRLLPRERGLAQALLTSLEAQRDEKMELALPVVENTTEGLLRTLDEISRQAQKKPPKIKSLPQMETHFLPLQSVDENARRILLARLSLLRSYESCLSDSEKVTELHEMRIEAKRLRYTLEIFASRFGDEEHRPGYEAALLGVKGLQDRLGAIHDADVTVPLLSEFLAKSLQNGYGQNENEELIVGTQNVDYAGCAGLIKLCLREQISRQTAFTDFQLAWQKELNPALKELETLCENLTTNAIPPSN